MMMMSSSLFKDAKRRRFRRLLWTKSSGSGAHLLDLRRSSSRSGVGVDVGGAGVEKKVRQGNSEKNISVLTHERKEVNI